MVSYGVYGVTDKVTHFEEPSFDKRMRRNLIIQRVLDVG